jgi:hypothetical protein
MKTKDKKTETGADGGIDRDRKIEVRILDDTGHTLLLETPAMVMERLSRPENAGKFVYADGVLVYQGGQRADGTYTIGELSRIVENATQITIDAATVGG